MRDVLIDVRCLQDTELAETDAGRTALALLREARAALPGDVLIGLIDPYRAVPDHVRGLLDAVRPNAYTGAMRRPTCFVQLSPGTGDPLAVARLLLHAAIPAVALPSGQAEPAAAAHAVRQHWAGRYDRVFAPDRAFWPSIAALAPTAAPALVTGRRATVALLTPDAKEPLCAALRSLVDLEVYAPGPPLGDLPLLSPRFDRVVSLLGNTAAHEQAVEAVARLGGAAVVADSSLLAAYGERTGRALALAEAELGRPISERELTRWRADEIRMPALLLGEIVGAAEPLIVHSSVLAEQVRTRYGRDAAVIPRPAAASERSVPDGGPLRIAVTATALAATACVWALDTLRFWGVPAGMQFVGEPEPELRMLLCDLDLEQAVTFAPAPADADAVIVLAMRGAASLTGVLADACGRGQACVASRSVVEAFDPPGWVRPVPDEPSPLLIAEAVLAAVDARPGDPEVQAFRGLHDPARCARLLCEALGIG